MLSELVPSSLKQYLKLLILKHRYPNRSIQTPFIEQNVILGRDCFIGWNARISSGVVIGDQTYVNAGTTIFSGKIGKFTSIGYNCQIGPAEHPTDFLSTSPRTYGRHNVFGNGPSWVDYAKPTIVGNDVWIGSNSIVLQGCTIGDGSVVAAGAVVTQDVPPYAIMGGVPAKVIRFRFDEDTVQQLLRLRWWDMPESQLAILGPAFAAGQDFLTVIRELGLLHVGVEHERSQTHPGLDVEELA